MKGKKCFGLLLALFTILWSLLSVYSDVKAIQTTADANRFLYAVSLQYNQNSTWSDLKRYNEYVSYAELSASQMNTYPNIKPSGRNVSISGKMNISLADRTNQYFPYVTSLWDLTVVCGWGDVPLVTDGASVTVNEGNWEGVMDNNQAKVTYLDVNFNWNGHFTGDYNNVSSDALLSCNVRRKTWRDSSHYYQPFAIGTLNNTYVYADNSSYDSYLTVSASDDQDINAIKGVQDAVVNLQNNLTEQNTTIINQNQEVIDRDNQDRSDIENQKNDADDSADSSQSQAESTGTTLLAAFTSFVNAITSASPSNCNIDMDLGNLDLGVVDFCTLSPPAPIPTIASIFMILFCVPLSIATARKVISLFRSFQ